MNTSPTDIETSQLAIDVIVMPGDEVAWHEISRKFADGMLPPLQRFDAVVGDRLSPEELRECLAPRAEYEILAGRRYPYGWVHEGVPSRGAVGCYLSHFEVWKKAAGRTIPTLVLEQDAEPAVPVQKIIEAIARIPANVDYVFLGHEGFYQSKLTRLLTSRPANGFHPVEATSDLFCTHAYVVTPQGAKKLCAQALPITCQVDSFMRFLSLPGRGFTIQAHHPPLLRQAARLGSGVQARNVGLDHLRQGTRMALEAVLGGLWGVFLVFLSRLRK